jgi:hypothetical protein
MVGGELLEGCRHVAGRERAGGRYAAALRALAAARRCSLIQA